MKTEGIILKTQHVAFQEISANKSELFSIAGKRLIGWRRGSVKIQVGINELRICLADTSHQAVTVPNSIYARWTYFDKLFSSKNYIFLIFSVMDDLLNARKFLSVQSKYIFWWGLTLVRPGGVRLSWARAVRENGETVFEKRSTPPPIRDAVAALTVFSRYSIDIHFIDIRTRRLTGVFVSSYT